MRADLIFGAAAIVVFAAAACAQPVDRSADLAAVETQFLAVDASYSDSARAAAEAKFAALQETAGGLSDAEFELALAELATLADNGHTRLLTARWAGVYNRLAVRFLIADDGLWVADAADGYAQHVGRRVAAIDGQDLDALRTAWARYFPGTEGQRDDSMYTWIESPEMLHAAGVAGASDHVALTFANGDTVDVGVTDAWPAPVGFWNFIPQARHIELAEAGAIDGDPLYLQEPAAMFRLVELADRDAVYLQFRTNHDHSGAVDVKAASDAAIDALRENPPRFVIVDQRFNFGGDLNNTRALMQALPEIVGEDGRVFAITSGRTFSAGIASLGYLKQAGGERVTIVGAPIGDRLEFWAEGGPIVLASGAALLAASERHNYMTGCPEADCHGSIRENPIAVAAEALDPDVRPDVTCADVVAGRDPYLEAVFALIDDAG